MRLSTVLTAAALAFAASLPAMAQHSHNHGASPAKAEAAAPTLADGEVRRIDKDASKITLKHGPIKSLDMPPMTMVFQVQDKALLDKVKAGDKVKFTAIQSAGGAYTVTSIEPAN